MTFKASHGVVILTCGSCGREERGSDQDKLFWWAVYQGWILNHRGDFCSEECWQKHKPNTDALDDLTVLPDGT